MTSIRPSGRRIPSAGTSTPQKTASPKEAPKKAASQKTASQKTASQKAAGREPGAKKKPRTQTRTRVRALPVVFHYSILHGEGRSDEAIRATLYEWVKLGLVSSVGGRAGIYVNRVRLPQGSPPAGEIIHTVSDIAMLTGWSALDLLNGRPPGSDLVAAVPRGVRTPTVPGITWTRRPLGWFEQACVNLSPLAIKGPVAIPNANFLVADLAVLNPGPHPGENIPGLVTQAGYSYNPQEVAAFARLFAQIVDEESGDGESGDGESGDEESGDEESGG